MSSKPQCKTCSYYNFKQPRMRGNKTWLFCIAMPEPILKPRNSFCSLWKEASLETQKRIERVMADCEIQHDHAVMIYQEKWGSAGPDCPTMRHEAALNLHYRTGDRR